MNVLVIFGCLAVGLVGCSVDRDVASYSVSQPSPAVEVRTITAFPPDGGTLQKAEITRYSNDLFLTVVNVHIDICVEVWDKAVSGTTRIGEPLYRSCGLRNGVHELNASQWACHDLQVDLGGPGGGLLASKQMAAWGECRVPVPVPWPSRPPTPSPSPCDDAAGCE